METNYYLVKAMCGHVGARAYIPIIFPVAAKSGAEAAKIARWIPRVKHHYKNAILDVKKVTFEEYEEQMRVNSNDAYLNWNGHNCNNTEYYSDIENRKKEIVDDFEDDKKKTKKKKKHLDYRRTTMIQIDSDDLDYLEFIY